MNEAADLVVRYGGSLSGEHGDGQLRAELLPKMFGPELIRAFREFKSIWDPNCGMNPGKVVDPYKLDENLTREEQYTTRGRAHLLFEMLRGDSILEGWHDEHVKDALDLCLSCKGCKGDCPVSVDIATYKAEFLSHYWEGRLRPRTAYVLGLVDVWMRAASLAPGLANLVTQTPLLRDFAKAAAGIAPQRAIPAVAPQSFRQWFRSRARENGRPKVILWPDTFNNYFHPDIAQAAVAVLDAAGFDIAMPRQSLCCGRPLYDFGMLQHQYAGAFGPDQ